MGPLVLLEQGLRLGIRDGRFVLGRGDDEIERIRVAEVDRVLVFGHVEITSSALHRLLRDGTDTVFLTAGGRYRGRLEGAAPRSGALRLRQYAACSDDAWRIRIARRMVRGKILNQRAVLLRAQRTARSPEIASALARMRAAAGATVDAADHPTLLGLEGVASAAYFGAFGRCIRNDRFPFGGRNRRPPRDEVNALLSFGYTLLGALAESLLRRSGLDPMLGLLHEPAPGRPSLALDLIEEFRPIVVDALALRMVNRREIRPEDFERPGPDRTEAILGGDAPEDGGPGPQAVLLGPIGRRIFFGAWDRKLRERSLHDPTSLRLSTEQAIEQQVRAVRRAIRDDAPDGYAPHRIR